MNIFNNKWATRFLHLARVVSSWSKDPSTRVGAVIVSQEGDPISFGFNGFPRGVRETPTRMERPLKYEFSVHAEENAIYLAKRDLKGTVMFVTCFPCTEKYVKAIIQAGIAVLGVDKNYKKGKEDDPYSSVHSAGNSIGREMLQEAGVTIIELHTADDISRWENIDE
jgi:dCMP deaminase